jgi:hypothetical protein
VHEGDVDKRGLQMLRERFGDCVGPY